MSAYKVVEEFPVSLNLQVVIRWIMNIKKADEEVHIESMRRRRWIFRNSETEQDVLVLMDYDVTIKFDDVETDGIRILFYRHGKVICTMHPRVGWLAKRLSA